MNKDQYWGGLAAWLAKAARSRRPGRALVVGLSAPQGAGKTTLTREVVRRLAAEGLRAVAVSLDDFYLTRAEQVALSERHPGNPYFVYRGLPGTHEVPLALATVRTLAEATGPVRVPSYDKTRFSGLGDRVEQGAWPVAEGPFDLVLVEGWMVGFEPVPAARVEDSHFRLVNAALASYLPLWAALDAFVWIEADDIGHVRRWRGEAEAKVIAEGKPGMTPEQVQAFVTPYLKGYDTYLPGMRERWPPAVPHLRVLIGGDRLPLGDTFVGTG